MKNLLTALLAFTLSLGVIAEVPSLINYQGKLVIENFGSFNGSGNCSLRIFDQKTGGKLIYQEDVGKLIIKNGVYSFGFGEAGKSVSTATETIGFTDGEKQVFNYTVKNTPILGETKISASDYSWAESGPSDATKFTATANKNNGAISAIFIAGVPDEGQQISISYDHHSDGIMGALSQGGQAWLELTFTNIDNDTGFNDPGNPVTLSPRERLVTVPFALRAGVADNLSKDIMVPIWKEGDNLLMNGQGSGIDGLFFNADNVPERQLVRHNNGSRGLISKFHVPACKKLVIVFEVPNISLFTNNGKFNKSSNKEVKFDVSVGNFVDRETQSTKNRLEFQRTSRYTYELNSPKAGIYGLEIYANKLSERFSFGIEAIILYAVY